VLRLLELFLRIAKWSNDSSSYDRYPFSGNTEYHRRRMKNLYTITHEHEHGADSYLFRSRQDYQSIAVMDEALLAESLGISYEPEKEEVLTINLIQEGNAIADLDEKLGYPDSDASQPAPATSSRRGFTHYCTQINGITACGITETSDPVTRTAAFVSCPFCIANLRGLEDMAAVLGVHHVALGELKERLDLIEASLSTRTVAEPGTA